MKKLVIFGGGDAAISAHYYLTKDSPHEIVAFTAHNAGPGNDSFLGLEMVPFQEIEGRYPPERFAMFIAISEKRINKNRADVFEACRKKGYELISYISSRASHWDEPRMGSNCMILENSAIQPFARIGHNVVICIGALIGRGAVISDHCFIGPGALIAGSVTVGPRCFIGAHSTLRDGIRIGEGCVIGAGALMLRDAPEGHVYLAKGTEPASISAEALGPYFGMPMARPEKYPVLPVS